MSYTEIKKRNEKKYYYRVISVRKEKKISKKRKYLGVNLSVEELAQKEKQADKELLKNKSIEKEIRKDAIEKIKPKIIKILKKNKIKKAGIFGSYVRGKQRKNSDIDILIQPTKDMSLLGFVGVKLELEDALGKKIDLVSYKGIHPLLKKQILGDEVMIL